MCIQRNHTRAGQNYGEERLNKNMMFKTTPAVRLKRLFEENDDTGAQGHKNRNRLLCNGELEVALCV